MALRQACSGKNPAQIGDARRPCAKPFLIRKFCLRPLLKHYRTFPVPQYPIGIDDALAKLLAPKELGSHW